MQILNSQQSFSKIELEILHNICIECLDLGVKRAPFNILQLKVKIFVVLEAAKNIHYERTFVFELRKVV